MLYANESYFLEVEDQSGSVIEIEETIEIPTIVDNEMQTSINEPKH